MSATTNALESARRRSPTSTNCATPECTPSGATITQFCCGLREAHVIVLPSDWPRRSTIHPIGCPWSNSSSTGRAEIPGTDQSRTADPSASWIIRSPWHAPARQDRSGGCVLMFAPPAGSKAAAGKALGLGRAGVVRGAVGEGLGLVDARPASGALAQAASRTATSAINPAQRPKRCPGRVRRPTPVTLPHPLGVANQATIVRGKTCPRHP
ncbi:MAG TPA: hypothetical protein VKB75_00315 [Jatrophihabitans sp.]|nr:hypothetical protein [Jatrophihabitans sp.]